MKVLSTKWLDTVVCEQLAQAGIDLTEKNFIVTELLAADVIKEEMYATNAATHFLVFTSANAVHAVGDFIKEKTGWKIYCLSGKTKAAVLQYFSLKQVAATADDAAALAEKIIARGIKEVIFFCGDKRRDILPQSLEAAGIDVKEIMVYNTIQVTEKMNESFESILFFSPSAVKSFFRSNKINRSVTCFAIGNTTAAEIKKHATSKIIIADVPTQQALAAKVIDHYKKTAKV